VTYVFLEFDAEEDRRFASHVRSHDETNWMTHAETCAYCLDAFGDRNDCYTTWLRTRWRGV